jgi:SAM-dependent methyltransferase
MAGPIPQDAGGPHALMRAGRAEEAARLYRQIVEANPRRPDAHNNLAVALKATGKTGQAIESYRRALKLDPTYATARFNLARALRETGEVDAALTQFSKLLQGRPEDGRALAEVIETLIGAVFRKPSVVARRLFLDLFQRRDVDLQRLSLPAIRLLMTNKRLTSAFEAAARAYPNGVPDRGVLSRDLADPLLIAVLLWTIPPSRKIEQWATVARKVLLDAAIAGRMIAIDPDLAWALAAHFQATEHAAPTPAGATDQAMEIAQGGSGDGDSDLKIAIAAMFLSLGALPAARGSWRDRASTSKDNSPMRLAFKRAIEHPEIEAEIARDLESLTEIEDQTSRSVRAQYEANPYPKWLSTDRPSTPLTLGERLEGRFPVSEAVDMDLARPRILVAGCGTGRHAITTAARYKDSTVLAIDISAASLAYASRRARELEQTNISFARGDILGLSVLKDRFDLVECSGVLHHMADPVAGWRVLRGLLKPGGIMRIGLYSARARRRWETLRDPIPGAMDPFEAATLLRSRRGALLSNPPAGPESIVLQIADFYSLSGCRDLLYHTSEIQFSPPEIAAALEALDLDFLGFDALSEESSRSYRDRFPQPGAAQDLAKWDAFEADNPDTFMAMYQFWCQARG